MRTAHDAERRPGRRTAEPQWSRQPAGRRLHPADGPDRPTGAPILRPRERAPGRRRYGTRPLRHLDAAGQPADLGKSTTAARARAARASNSTMQAAGSRALPAYFLYAHTPIWLPRPLTILNNNTNIFLILDRQPSMPQTGCQAFPQD